MNCEGARAFGVLTVLALLFASAIWPLQPAAWANGGTLRLNRANAGPYAVSVWAQPDPPQVGHLHVSVAVMQLESKRPVLDAEVRLTAARIDREGSPLSGVAIRGAGANKLLYHADLELPAEGHWRVRVGVAGPLGTGSEAFTLDVEPPVTVDWPRAGAVLALVLVGLAGGFLHFSRSRPKGRG